MTIGSFRIHVLCDLLEIRGPALFSLLTDLNRSTQRFFCFHPNTHKSREKHSTIRGEAVTNRTNANMVSTLAELRNQRLQIRRGEAKLDKVKESLAAKKGTVAKSSLPQKALAKKLNRSAERKSTPGGQGTGRPPLPTSGRNQVSIMPFVLCHLSYCTVSRFYYSYQ